MQMRVRTLISVVLLVAACATAPDSTPPDPGYPGIAAAERVRSNHALRQITPEVLELSTRSYRALLKEGDGGADLVRARSAELRRRLATEVDRAYLATDGRVDLELALLYLDAVEHRAQPRPSRGDASGVGRAEFTWLLTHRHMVSDTPEEIVRTGRRLLAETRREMAVIVERLYPGLDITEGMARLKDLAPPTEELPEVARRAMESARNFVIERDLVTVPRELREGTIVPLSDRMARSYPFGAYGGAREIDGQMTGVYLVNVGASWMTAEQRQEGRRGNDPFKTRVIAIHEMWPGHHLQRGVAKRNGNPLRRSYYTPFYGEGWALYSEELLYRHGFYTDDRTRLAQLGMRRWRCARVILDPSLHLGWMTPEEAVEFLIREVDLERTNAEAEVRRYLENPTRPMSYVYGWLFVEQLRRDCLLAGMREKEFHDRFLATGPIPLPLVRMLLLDG